jgi:tryptophan synthase alpha chain
MSESRMVKVLTQPRKVLVAYLCVGDPSPAETLALALAAVRGGADMIELGVPFSDPSADGAVIARASERALSHGSNVDMAIEVARQLRAASEVPIVIFGYYNPLLAYGEKRFIGRALDAGVDAILCVDLPFDEPAELRDAADAAGISIVPLVAPTTTDARLAQLKQRKASHRIDFAYYVSVAGVTGSVAVDAGAASVRAVQVSAMLDVPVVVGFGIDSAEKARTASAGVRGVVVGSALVSAIASAKDAQDRLLAAENLVSLIRGGLDASRNLQPC